MTVYLARNVTSRLLRQFRHTVKTKPHVRQLNLLEYQSKALLQNYGVTIQKFTVLDSAKTALEESKKLGAAEFVIKAQILAGGRGKGHFANGFKGGVHFTKDPHEVGPLVEKMVGQRLVTKQTPAEGIVVKKVMVAESVDILRETYFCILMDRDHNGPVLLASPDGGVDIEEVAAKTPERILTLPVDIMLGLSRADALKVADFLNFTGKLRDMCADEVEGVWRMFLHVDATQIEINPLIETTQGRVVAVDAKIQFDDNAEFRQKEIFASEDTSECDPREVDAARHNLTFIGMTGNIGCLVNGAGLAMATMDIIALHGGSPANFLDLGGGVNEDQVYQAFRILTTDPLVQGILVNVFGGIVNCATIANGIINASKHIDLKVPIVVRLEGTNVEQAKQILADSGLPIQFAADLDEAAQKAVASIQ